MDVWAEDAATRTEPEALWEDLAEKDEHIGRLQEKVEMLMQQVEKLKSQGDSEFRYTSDSVAPQQVEAVQCRLEKLDAAFASVAESASEKGAGDSEWRPRKRRR